MLFFKDPRSHTLQDFLKVLREYEDEYYGSKESTYLTLRQLSKDFGIEGSIYLLYPPDGCAIWPAHSQTQEGIVYATVEGSELAGFVESYQGEVPISDLIEKVEDIITRGLQ